MRLAAATVRTALLAMLLGSSTAASGGPIQLDPQAEALRRVRSVSTITPEIRFVDGFVASLAVRIPFASGASDSIDRALDFLDSYRDLYGVEAPRAQLYLQRRIIDPYDVEHLFFGQQQGTVPVWGAQLAVHLDGQRLLGTNGRLLHEAAPADVALVPVEVAVTIARGSIPGYEITATAPARQTIFSPELIGAPGPPRLAWRVSLQGRQAKGGHGVWTVLVDARDGKILDSVDEVREHPAAVDIQWRDAAGATRPSCDRLGAPLVDPDLLPDGRRGRVASSHTYDWFHEEVHRHGFDDTGVVPVTLRYANGSAEYNPACNDLLFDEGFLVLDVFAHEFTHGVIRWTSDLGYHNQSGALNESYADVMAAVVEGTELGVGDDRTWLIGEEFPGGPFRSMIYPPRYSDPDVGTTPDHMDDFIVTGVDHGAVHFNSGIPNKAAYLLGHGGSFHGYTIAGIGVRKLGRLYYDVLTTRLTGSATFIEARDATVAQARLLLERGELGFVPRDLCSTMDAFASVGLGQGCQDAGLDADDDSIPDAWDNCNRPNPGQQDFDHDGRGDACDEDADGDTIDEDGDHSGSAGDRRCRGGDTTDCDDNCPLLPNRDQADRNGDGQGDACDDSDYDRVPDARDNCPNDPNPGQENLDGDGQGDVCDGDVDGDGIPELPRDFAGPDPVAALCTGGRTTGCYDNCVVRWDLTRSANRSQADSDGDRLGDTCDNCPGFASRDFSDDDGDLVGNACDLDDDNDGICDAGGPPPPAPPGGGCVVGPHGVDNCPWTPNTDQMDFDGDGTGTLCDSDEPDLLSGDVGGILRGLALFPFAPVPVRMPLDVCRAGSCPARWPLGVETQVRVKLAGSFEARVLDSRGWIVARRSGQGEVTLDFATSSATKVVVPGLPQPLEHEAYALEIAPGAGLLGKQLPIEVSWSTEAQK